jgi:hypothetical protein
MKDILVVLLIIGISYLFTLTETKKFDTQLMFILLGLTVVIVYKFIHYKNITKTNVLNESFTTDKDVSDKIDDWANNALTTNSNVVSPNVEELKTNANTIIDNQKQLNELYSKLLEKSEGTATTTDSDDSAQLFDLTSSQTLQDTRLRLIKQKIEDLKLAIKKKENQMDAVDYPKIPIYSSCVVADANGEYSDDSVQNTGSVSGSGVIGDTVNMVGKPEMGGTSGDNNSPNNGLNNALSKLLSNGIDIKIM